MLGAQVAARVLRVVPGEQPALLVPLREHEADEHGTEQHGDDPGRVRPVSPSRNDFFAAAMIASAYCGILLGAASALENDFVSSLVGR